jgi:cell division septal protein FtsQ
MPAVRLGLKRKQKRSSVRLGVATAQQPREDEARQLGTGHLVWIKLPAMLLLIASVYALYLFFNDARFMINQVGIEGNNLVPANEVRQAVGLEGISIFWVNPEDIEEWVAAQFGIMEHVDVSHRLPNHVTIRLRERDEVLVWQSGGQYWWVDVTGQVLGAAAGPGQLVVIHDVGEYAPDPGDRIAGVPFRLAWDLVSALPGIRAYDYTRDEGLVLHITEAHWPVYLGYQGEAREKAAVMQSLAEQLVAQRSRVSYIDLRNENRPTYKP